MLVAPSQARAYEVHQKQAEGVCNGTVNCREGLWSSLGAKALLTRATWRIVAGLYKLANQPAIASHTSAAWYHRNWHRHRACVDGQC